MSTSKSSWKLFRIICILQMILVAFQLMLSFSDYFYTRLFISITIKVLLYAVIFIFIYVGLSIINYNYPDKPLTPRQKRSFNWLFIINFLLIAFLFAEVVNTWWVVPWWIINSHSRLSNIVLFTWWFPFILSTTIFLLHMVYLGGMFRLRRVIYQNTIKGWYDQFEDNQKQS